MTSNHLQKSLRFCLRLMLPTLVGLAILPIQATSQILPDAVSSAVGYATGTLSWPHTVGLGSNGILVVGISNRRSNRTVTSIQYAGLNLTRVGFRNSLLATSRMEMWQLLAPPQGTGNIVVTLSGSSDLVGGATSFFGIDPTTPLGTFASAGGDGSTASISAASSTGEIVMDVVASPGTSITLTPGMGQTVQWNDGSGTGGSDARGASSTKTGAPSVPVSWTFGAATDWAIGAVSLKPLPYPNLALSLTQDNMNPPPETTVTFTITYTNSGNGAAVNSLIAFSAPPNTVFVNDGVLVNGVGKSDAADGDEVTRSGSSITVNLGSVPGGTSGTIVYRVVIQ